MKKHSPIGKLNGIEHVKSARDAVVHIVSGVLLTGFTAIVTYLSTQDFESLVTSETGVYAGIIIWAVNSYLAPFLNRLLNAWRV